MWQINARQKGFPQKVMLILFSARPRRYVANKPPFEVLEKKEKKSLRGCRGSKKKPKLRRDAMLLGGQSSIHDIHA